MGLFTEIKEFSVHLKGETSLDTRPLNAPKAYISYNEQTEKTLSSLIKGKKITIDNKPTKGFKIVDYLVSGRNNNKLWLIYDPRGFVVELTTENMYHLILNANIEQGNIINECLWARRDGNYVLVGKDTELYQQYITDVELRNLKKILNKELKPGFMYLNGSGEVWTYLGTIQYKTETQYKKPKEKLTDYQLSDTPKPTETRYILGKLTSSWDGKVEGLFCIVANPELKKEVNKVDDTMYNSLMSHFDKKYNKYIELNNRYFDYTEELNCFVRERDWLTTTLTYRWTKRL